MNRGKNIFILTLLIGMLFLIAGCSNNPEFKLYDGKELSIAVLGTKPEAKEKQIEFQEIAFDEFNKEEIKKYDAVFITKENLSQAAESQYAEIYSNSHMPFFFIESNKDAYPFIDADLSYEDAREIPNHNYFATGFLETLQNEQKTWTYDLYNDQVNEENIRDVFSKIFKTIEENPKN